MTELMEDESFCCRRNTAYGLRRIGGGLDIRGLPRELSTLLMLSGEQAGIISSMNDGNDSLEAIADYIEATRPGPAVPLLSEPLAWHFSELLLPTYIPDPNTPVPVLPKTFRPIEEINNILSSKIMAVTGHMLEKDRDSHKSVSPSQFRR